MEGERMSQPKWSKADAKRAERMGWHFWADYGVHRRATWITRHGTTFRTDAEAVEWVVRMAETGIRLDGLASITYGDLVAKKKTCRKAIILCCTGGKQ
jgi:hypothetical protein